jgi:hypothetical protein
MMLIIATLILGGFLTWAKRDVLKGLYLTHVGLTTWKHERLVSGELAVYIEHRTAVVKRSEEELPIIVENLGTVNLDWTLDICS